MYRTVLKTVFFAMLATCAVLCALCVVQTPFSSVSAVFAEQPTQAEAASDTPDGALSVQALENTWTAEPAISGFQYGCFTTVSGVAEQGTVKFSVYAVHEGIAETTPVNDVLTNFTLVDGGVSAEVKDAMNTLNVGSYLLRAAANADGYDPLEQDVAFDVTKFVGNKWRYGGSPKLVGWAYGETPRRLSGGVPFFGTVRYTLQGYNIPGGIENFETMEDFNAALARTGSQALGNKDEYKEYTVTFTVDGTDNYDGFTHTLTFGVKRNINPVDFYVNSFSFGVGLHPIDAIKIEYGINNTIDLELTTAMFSVIDANGNAVIQHSVFLRDDGAGTAQKTKKAFIVKISELDAGTYTIRQDIFEGETYGACFSEQKLEIFSVALPGVWADGASAWNKDPSFVDGQGKPVSGVWQFGQVAPNIQVPIKVLSHSAVPNGINVENEIVKTYYKRIIGDDGTETKGEKVAQDIGGSTANMPRDVGKFFVEFTVLENKNYYLREEDVKLLPFEITTADDWTFTTSPYAVGWTWGTFDKNVNLFGAVPTRGGAVSFTVKKDGAAVDGLENFRVDAQNVIIDENGLSGKLNGLGSGIYTLEVQVASSGNYTAYTAETTFRIAQASNSWTVSPNIARWAQYYFKAEENTPVSEARYGDVVMEVRSKDGGEIFYRSKNGVASVSNLAAAAAGWYTFTASVAETANYSGLNYDIEFQVFTESADMPTNHWVVVPVIESWIAGSTPSVPLGQSLRGEVIITYCKAELKDGKYVAVGDAADEQPEEPGKYFMYARVRHEELPQDELLKHDVMFDIFERVNEWTVTPSIQSYTLGEGPSVPTAEVLYTDECVIDIKYRPKHGGDVSPELPRVPGEYVMVVTATAKYCAPLTAEVDFTVSLSQNSWINAPTIKDWSEEETAGIPIGEAAVGSERIVYTYARADKPNEKFADKPTSEGSYIMYATLELDGYETLTAQWEFTVISAFDRTLMTFDIILGIVCCICTAVAIFFAVKRSRQNS